MFFWKKNIFLFFWKFFLEKKFFTTFFWGEKLWNFEKTFPKKRKIFFFKKTKFLFIRVKCFFSPKTIYFYQIKMSAKLSVFKNGCFRFCPRDTITYRTPPPLPTHTVRFSIFFIAGITYMKSRTRKKLESSFSPLKNVLSDNTKKFILLSQESFDLFFSSQSRAVCQGKKYEYINFC